MPAPPLLGRAEPGPPPPRARHSAFERLGLVCALPGMGPESSRRSHRVQWDSLVAGTPADVNHCGRRIGEVCPQKGVRHGFEPCRTGTHSGR